MRGGRQKWSFYYVVSISLTFVLLSCNLVCVRGVVFSLCSPVTRVSELGVRGCAEYPASCTSFGLAYHSHRRPLLTSFLKPPPLTGRMACSKIELTYICLDYTLRFPGPFGVATYLNLKLHFCAWQQCHCFAYFPTGRLAVSSETDANWALCISQ